MGHPVLEAIVIMKHNSYFKWVSSHSSLLHAGGLPLLFLCRERIWGLLRRFGGGDMWDTALATMQHPQIPLRGSPGNARQGIPRGLGLRELDLPRASLTCVSRVGVPLTRPQSRWRARMLRDKGLQVGSWLLVQSELAYVPC